jgi:glycosyltransferase involved in cell wall biosynthesis
MRILFVSFSSVVDVYQDKLRYLAAMPDVELFVLLPTHFKEGGRVVAAHLGDGSYTVITRPAPMANKGHYNRFFFRNLRSVFREVKPDLVHIEAEPESVVTVQVVRHALRLKRTPAMVCFTWRNMPFPLEHWPVWHPKTIFFTLSQLTTIPHFDAIISGTHEAEADLRRRGFEGPMPIIPQYGIDPQTYHRPENRDALRAAHGMSGFVVGFAGRLLKMKGLDVLVDAIARVDRPDVQCVILGSGEYAEAVMQRASERGVAHRIRIVNGVPVREVPQILACFDVLAVPSLTYPHWKEQFGRVIPEAMACGVPVIGSDSGEIPHVVGDAGIITPEGDAEALASAIRQLYDDRSLLQTLSDRGVERVRTMYTNKHIAEQIYATWCSVLPAPRP